MAAKKLGTTFQINGTCYINALAAAAYYFFP